MELRLTPLDSIQSFTRIGQALTKAVSLQGQGFHTALVQALQETSSLGKESGRLSKEFILENPTISLERTMLAGAKSGIAFQATMQTRNKVLAAYTEVMNMQI